ncbi:hypothetical protein [Brevibacillus porteri]|uniref:DUF4037 domain-containing protein n=1 Tax=Brevibacillus porteri TaxID=2126350 RepID=A0ABX5FK21_9BACL|nr:hypothetical protein [Brevibacillus porteri]MED1800079.1 hypothetical protein [Brevibacillus porteri]MED2134489.1 hypothetical protein [Brevibacillus porteri]MED2747186.1 hypothetical protein [Brevibacillus porteri]MED2812450.1 hypothetical protein [Brevibacillus porteri]MED2897009.1 hypothetical protein [Brevibacillus porteri]
MNRYYGLFIGTAIPFKHLKKIIRKFNYAYYAKASPERKQHFIEIIPEFHISHSHDPYHWLECIMVEPAFLNRFLEIINNLDFTFILCQYRHGHFQTMINESEYSVTSFRSLEDVVYLVLEDDTDRGFAKKLLTLPLEKQFASAPGIKTSEDYQHLLDTWVKEVLAYPAKNA